MIRKAKAFWRGAGRDGKGQLSSESGVLAETPYSFKTRFENEKGTNPEELIAAAHAACFTMAMAFGLQLAGFKPTELSTDSKSASRLSPCVEMCPVSARRNFPASPAKPKRIAQCRKFSMPRSRWMRS
jgi:OsmC-like protein